MLPTPKPSGPVNSDAGISGEVTFSQTLRVPDAGASMNFPAAARRQKEKMASPNFMRADR